MRVLWFIALWGSYLIVELPNSEPIFNLKKSFYNFNYEVFRPFWISAE